MTMTYRWSEIAVGIAIEVHGQGATRSSFDLVVWASVMLYGEIVPQQRGH